MIAWRKSLFKFLTFANYKRYKVHRTAWGNQRFQRIGVTFLNSYLFILVIQIIITKSNYYREQAASFNLLLLLCTFFYQFDSFAVWHKMYHLFFHNFLSQRDANIITAQINTSTIMVDFYSTWLILFYI